VICPTVCIQLAEQVLRPTYGNKVSTPGCHDRFDRFGIGDEYLLRHHASDSHFEDLSWRL
jgi:hypothetical protein